ncbi:putative translation initiation inhibitor, yjgF family [Candidatus Rhodobacter oscarellae]|uniref:Putative translation initiation inhibitor, yjgF family n=1 Tax=Candidatus Rhodobacter oscarellae TaxID=1675527 RepID=A0A0J9E948_9RHOB|nr:Rid family hydrolase [Candidatus Rhodobacter lobularis]KMW59317.1 putative translation initiation inhibitor, yjgF family [Candidatus Rhodobacter lobularis]
MIRKAQGGGRFEEIGSYSRAKRVGPFVYVAGTTAIEPSGKLHAPGDAYAQTHYILQRIEAALRDVGAELRHVMRVRAYFTADCDTGGFVRAHGEVFAGIEPVLTGVTAGLSQPGMVVEIDVDAIVHDEDGTIAG